jgi:pimeloyl-ACP methyl ester carboxylesterase
VRADAPTVLLVHDIDHNESFWRYLPGSARDFSRALAARGLRVLTIDRLGYGASPHPAGDATCLGAQADMVHQVLGSLRSGRYMLGDRAGPPASHVGVVADAVGSAITELVTYSWPGDTDALALMSWSDPAPSALAVKGTLRASMSCLVGGVPSRGARDYSYFATSDAEYRQDFLFGAPADVQAGVAALREPDPCGDYRSLVQLVAANISYAPEIHQPVLLLYGRHDPLLTSHAAQQQRSLLRSSHGVSTEFLAYSSGDLTVDGDYRAVQSSTATWMCARLGGCRR